MGIYVARDLSEKSAEQLAAWCDEHELTDEKHIYGIGVLPGWMRGYHVTIAYSRTDFAIPQPEFDFGEINLIGGHLEVLRGPGDPEGGLVVLRIESKILQARWQSFLDAGATWDFPEYKPHITLCQFRPGMVLDGLHFSDIITLGPEYTEQLNTEA